jgi:hypothetical protein
VISDICPNCHRRLPFEEILDGFKKNYYDSNTKCPACGKEFMGKFQMNVFEDERQVDSQFYELYSPLNIWRELENIIKTKGETYLLTDLFEKQQKDYFMNIILYMHVINVPVFFFCSKVTEYEHNFQQMEQLMVKQMNHHKQSTFFTKVFKEFDIYKQEIEKLGNY